MALRVVALAALAAVSAAQFTPPLANPFCSSTTERNTVTTSAVCTGGVIDEVVSAYLGTPAGACPSFAPGACDAGASFVEYARKTCVGSANCTLSSATFPDPCPGVVKTISAVFHCSGGGGYAPLPPPPSPNCALNGQGCPPPTWVPTYNLTQSTVIQPGAQAAPAFFTSKYSWGLISLDWSVAQSVWAAGGPANSTMEATLRANCAALKAAGSAQRCFMYHNTELALEWIEGQRAAMYQPNMAGYFLQYLPGNPSNVTAGTILNAHRSQGDQFCWNFSLLAAQQYYIAETAAALADPAVDGTFTDDVDGFPAEHNSLPAAIGISDSALADLRFATQQMGAALITTLVSQGKYTWQAFASDDTSAPGPLDLGVRVPEGRRVRRSSAGAFRGPVTPSGCASYMQQYCSLEYQGRPLLQHHDPSQRNVSIASFLITRPPHAYLGFAWESDDRDFDPLFYLQVGEPLGLCAEGPAGVFSREYSLGKAVLDCNTFNATLPFDSLPVPA